SAFTYYTGFKVNSGEYKVMGLAPYGQPRYRDLILTHLLDLKEDGSFKLNLDYFNYCQGLTMTNQKFADLFGGPPRPPESPLTQREMDLAASVQKVTEEVVLRLARHVHRETGEKHLVLAGGVALNCVANGLLLREGPFEDLWIQPAAGDAGGALGAALFAWHQHLGKPRPILTDQPDRQEGSYLGPAFPEDQIQAFLQEQGIPARKMSWEKLPLEVARLIAEEKIVGWFEGRMEFGPRALGNRSILGDARSPKMQSVMNLKIKFRESFRPFAPSVLAERCGDYFLLDRHSPYMLLVGEVQPGIRQELKPGDQDLFGLEKLKTVRSAIPAITHVDYSARVQTVHPETNPLYYRLLKAFEALTGCGVMVNTSFNVRGEPIVCTPEQAYACFRRTEMDCLVLGPFLLEKGNQPPWQETGDWRKEIQAD
ncbi:MAG TPA: carbamoyltransferase C-terminal domain-containing protein, partial [Thermodesulfobacteriota bacterium]|nr:carbamoyltransferase C-terminal domain-containing protein [Thermodesulfobacteriota bacterium]